MGFFSFVAEKLGCPDYVCPDAIGKLGSQICRIFPNYVAEVPGVECEFLHEIFPASPNHWTAKTLGKTGFKVDA